MILIFFFSVLFVFFRLSLQFDLLAAANMLELPRLVNICEQQLSPLMNTENVVAMYLAADHHQAKQLKEQCVRIDGFWISSSSLSLSLSHVWCFRPQIHSMTVHYPTLEKDNQFKKRVSAADQQRVKAAHEQYLNDTAAFSEVR